MKTTGQERLFLSPPHIGGQELEYVKAAFASNYVAPLGPMVDKFEEEFSSYTGIQHCLALSSGTAAMHLALRELGVEAGDLVISSTLTFMGSVSPATFLGATPVFVDSDDESWNMDPALLAEELASQARSGRIPKVVIVTDLYGQCADLDAIKQVCASYEVPVVVDAAEAVGATYKGRHAGKGAAAAIFSFNGNKILNTSGGGMLASDDADLIAHARKLSQQAREPLPYYEHHEIGYNYRLSNILAAIGRGQLAWLDDRVNTKRRIFEAYQEALGSLPGIAFMPECTTGRCNRWLSVMLIDAEEFGATPEELRLALEAENIESRPVWKPMHLQPVFRGCQVRGGEVSERLFKQGLCLPSGTAMTDADIERVITAIRSSYRSAAPKHISLKRLPAMH